MRFEGICSIWIDGNTEVKCGKPHTVNVCEGNPIGSISFYLDDFVYGCWEMGNIEGVEISRRDLQLITAWAALAIKSKHRDHGYKITEGCEDPGRLAVARPA